MAVLCTDGRLRELAAARRVRDTFTGTLSDRAVTVDASAVERLAGERIATSSTHGTGCTLSAAITAFLALGLAPLEAVVRAREYLIAAIRAAPGLGGGAGGPRLAD